MVLLPQLDDDVFNPLSLQGVIGIAAINKVDHYQRVNSAVGDSTLECDLAVGRDYGDNDRLADTGFFNAVDHVLLSMGPAVLAVEKERWGRGVNVLLAGLDRLSGQNKCNATGEETEK